MRPANALYAFTVIAAAPIFLANAAAAECGKASWYRNNPDTVEGKPLPKGSMTAAHRTLPMGARVEVRNTKNGKTAIVYITDRGPFIKSRIIDVSRGAMEALAMDGVANVCLTELKETPAPPADGTWAPVTEPPAASAVPQGKR
jgi:rare lipoprotein A